MAKKILSSHEDDERVAQLRERLTFLQTMAETTLDGKTNEILHGQEGDLKIHGGTIVEVHKRVEIKHEDSAKTLDEAVDATMEDGLRGVFSDRVKSAIGGIVKRAIATFYSNDSIGEVKQEDMIVVWDNNALLRVDYFLWRYNFSSKKIVEHVDSVFAYAYMYAYVQSEVLASSKFNCISTLLLHHNSPFITTSCVDQCFNTKAALPLIGEYSSSSHFLVC